MEPSFKKKDGYLFGKQSETISSALGKNKIGGTLSRTAKFLAAILDFIDKNHCINLIK